MHFFVSDTKKPYPLFRREDQNERLWKALEKAGVVDASGNLIPYDPVDPDKRQRKMRRARQSVQRIILRESDHHALVNATSDAIYEHLRLNFPLPPFGKVQKDLREASRNIAKEIVKESGALDILFNNYQKTSADLSSWERFAYAARQTTARLASDLKSDPALRYVVDGAVKREIERVLKENGLDPLFVQAGIGEANLVLEQILPSALTHKELTLTRLLEEDGKTLTIKGRKVSDWGEAQTDSYRPRPMTLGWEETLKEEFMKLGGDEMKDAKAAAAVQKTIGKWSSNPIKQGFLYAVTPWYLWPAVAAVKPDIMKLDKKLEMNWWGNFLQEHPKLEIVFKTSNPVQFRKLMEKRMWEASKRYFLSRAEFGGKRLWREVEFADRGKLKKAYVFTPFHALEQFTRANKGYRDGSLTNKLEKFLNTKSFFKGFSFYKKKKNKQEDDNFLWWAAANTGRVVLWAGKKFGISGLTKLDDVLLGGRVQSFIGNINNWWVTAETTNTWYGGVLRTFRVGGVLFKAGASGWKGGLTYGGIGYLISGGNPVVAVLTGTGGWAGKSLATFAQSESLVFIASRGGRFGAMARWLLKFRVPISVGTSTGVATQSFSLIRFPIKGAGAGGLIGYFVTGGNPVGGWIGTSLGAGVDYGYSVVKPIATSFIKYKAVPAALAKFPGLKMLSFLKYWKGGALGAAAGFAVGSYYGWPWYITVLTTAGGALGFGGAQYGIGRFFKFLKLKTGNIPFGIVLNRFFAIFEALKNPKAFFSLKGFLGDIKNIFGSDLSLLDRFGALWQSFMRLQFVEMGVGLGKSLITAFKSLRAGSGLGLSLKDLLRNIFGKSYIGTALKGALRGLFSGAFWGNIWSFLRGALLPGISTFFSALWGYLTGAFAHLSLLLTGIGFAAVLFLSVFALHFVIVTGSAFITFKEFKQGSARGTAYSDTTGEMLLEIKKSVDKATASAGEILTYTIVLTAGAQEVTEASIYDDIEVSHDGFLVDFDTFSATPAPTNVGDPISASYPSGLGAPNFKRVTWEIGTLAPNSSYTITYTIQVHSEYDPNPTVDLLGTDKSITDDAVGLGTVEGSEQSVSDFVVVNAVAGSPPNESPVPGGCITSHFHDDDRPDHQGVDIAANSGTPVYSPFPGTATVTNVGYHTALGYFVEITSGEFSAKFGHLYEDARFYERPGEPFIRIGDSVEPYEQVGVVGSTGTDSTGPHVHYELTLNGKHVDPEDYGVDQNVCPGYD